MKRIYCLALSAFLLLLFTAVTAEDSVTDSTGTTDTAAQEETGERSLVYIMEIDGAIGAVVDERIADAIDIADDDEAELLVIMLNTPGGFSSSTWKICKSILNSPVPVCMYVAPMGAKAGSAGVYMTYSAHFAAMAPASNIGAAHPVAGGGQEIDSVMNEKITNDAVAQIRSAAEKWGRNAEWAEKSVRESASITATEALEMNVIDFIAEDLDDLLRQIDGKETETPYGKQTMVLSRYVTDRIEPTFAQKFLEVITDPNIIFILFSIGGLGIVLELYNPGAILPGVVGAISLILAFYASSTIPINYAGVALIFLAIILWIAEIKVVSHGLLTVGGIISFFLGGLMLVDTVDPELKVSMSLLITTAVLVGGIVSLAIWLVIRAHQRQPTTGNEGLIGKKAEVRKADLVYVNGALWKAECDEEMEIGKKVEIVAVDGLILKVKKLNS